MKRYSRYLIGALLLIVVVLIGVGVAAAQSVQWTGHYYVVVAKGEDGMAAAYGHHGGWDALRPGPAFKHAEFVDFAVRPVVTELPSDALLPDHRYDLLAVGASNEGAVTIEGYEVEGGPFFLDEERPIPGLGTPYAVRPFGADYLVVGARRGDGEVLTGDYLVAVGRHGKWETVAGPDFHGGTFVDLAVGLLPPVADYAEPTELLAVGMLNGQAVVVAGTLANGLPAFSTETQAIRGVARPIAVEWTGAYYVVLGEDAAGAPVLVYGRPGLWNDAKPLVAAGAAITGFAVAPLVDVDFTKMAPAKRYDLLAVGTLKGLTVSVLGYEAVDFPTFEETWAEIPGFWKPGLAGVPVAALTAAAPEVGAPFPNPFAQSVSVAVTVAREQAVVVEAFDVLGQRVAVLHDGVLAAGAPHTFTLDGRGLASGTYLLRVRGEDFVQVRPAMLAR